MYANSEGWRGRSAHQDACLLGASAIVDRWAALIQTLQAAVVLSTVSYLGKTLASGACDWFGQPPCDDMPHSILRSVFPQHSRRFLCVVQCIPIVFRRFVNAYYPSYQSYFRHTWPQPFKRNSRRNFHAGAPAAQNLDLQAHRVEGRCLIGCSNRTLANGERPTWHPVERSPQHGTFVAQKCMLHLGILQRGRHNLGQVIQHSWCSA